MVQPDRNKFTLIRSNAQRIVFTPINWQELEVVLSRDNLAVTQEVAAEVRCHRAAAQAIREAADTGRDFKLRVETLTNDWTYDASYWEFKADVETFADDGSTVSIGFVQSGIKDLIDKNKGTKYDIDIPSTFTMKYSGVTLDKTNIITSVKNSAGMFYSLNRISSSNWIVGGVKSQTVRSDTWVFTDYTGFHGRSLKTNQPTITFFLGEIQFYLSSNYDNIRLNLLHCRPLGTGFQVRTTLLSLTHSSRIGTLRYIFQDFNTYTFENNGSAWTRNGVAIPLPEGVPNATLIGGDFVMLVVTAGGQDRVLQAEYDETLTTLSFESHDISPFSDYPVRVMPIDSVLSALLKKMTGITPTLTYNLPKHTDSTPWVPVLSSGSAVQHSSTPMMNVSFDDVMQFLRCAYGASYDVYDSTVVVDYVTSFFSSLKAIDVVPINGVQVKRDTEHVFNKVEVGWETDDDVENGQFEPLCKNVFSINSGVEGKTLDLVSPFKGSPYTIEQYMKDKATESSKTAKQDNDVFVFCVVPFKTSETVLYRGQLPSSTLFNIPLTPMRFLIANGRYIGVSLYNKSKRLIFVSTDRTAGYRSRIDGETYYIDEDSGTNVDLFNAISSPLFKPVAVEFKTAIKTPNKAAIHAMRHKYLSILDNKSGETIDFYINDISLPLTVGKEQEWIGIKR
jgi:hypothetical protein